MSAAGDERARRERAEADLRVSEARYRDLLDSVPVGIYRSTPDGRIAEANHRLAEMYGFDSVASLLAEDALSLYADPEERDRWQAELVARGSVVYEMQHRRRDGQLIWVRDHARAIRGEDGEIRYYDGIQEDITEWKHAVHTVQFQASLLKQVRNAVVATDAEDRITYWNPFAERLYGWSAEEVMGRSYEDVLPSPNESVGADFWAGIHGPGFWEGEIEVTGRDGTIIPTFLFAQRMIGEDGRPVGIVDVAIDLTERKRSEQALAANLEALRTTDAERRRLLERLVEAQEEERERLASDIHDDLVHVMTASALRLATVRRAPERDPDAVARVEESIQRAIGRLRHFVSELHPRELDRDGLAAALLSHLASVAVEGGPSITLENALSSDPPPRGRLTIYRAVQGTLAEARAGRAESVEIALTDEDETYRAHLEIAGHFVEEGGNGMAGRLQALGERIQLAGGRYLLRERPTGMTVEVVVDRREDTPSPVP